MRVTKYKINNMIRHLNQGLSRLDRYQQQLASGKKVLKFSDDPAGVISIMELRLPLLRMSALKNVGGALSWLESIDTVLWSATNVMHRAKELTGGCHSTLSSTSPAIRRKWNSSLTILELATPSHGGISSPAKSTTVPLDGRVTIPTIPAIS